MELTNKCKEDFEKYRLLKHNLTELEVRCGGGTIWEYLDDSMQYGVYVDFFDSVGIEVNVSKDEDKMYCLTIEFDDFKSSSTEWEDTRTEARVEALKTANEIYNNK